MEWSWMFIPQKSENIPWRSIAGTRILQKRRTTQRCIMRSSARLSTGGWSCLEIWKTPWGPAGCLSGAASVTPPSVTLWSTPLTAAAPSPSAWTVNGSSSACWAQTSFAWQIMSNAGTHSCLELWTMLNSKCRYRDLGYISSVSTAKRKQWQGVSVTSVIIWFPAPTPRWAGRSSLWRTLPGRNTMSWLSLFPVSSQPTGPSSSRWGSLGCPKCQCKGKPHRICAWIRMDSGMVAAALQDVWICQSWSERILMTLLAPLYFIEWRVNVTSNRTVCLEFDSLVSKKRKYYTCMKEDDFQKPLKPLSWN